MTAEQLKENLDDLNLPQETVEQIVQLYQSGNTAVSKQKLLLARSELLNQLHQSQNRLYQLDIVIHNLNS